MTTRSVPEWIGATSDTAIPPRVRLRVWTRCDGKCGECGRKIRTGESWIVEHLVALVNGGLNRESNLGITCGWCKPVKDARDVADKSKVASIRKKHLGITATKRKLQGPGFRKSPGQHSATRPIQRKGDRA